MLEFLLEFSIQVVLSTKKMYENIGYGRMCALALAFEKKNYRGSNSSCYMSAYLM